MEKLKQKIVPYGTDGRLRTPPPPSECNCNCKSINWTETLPNRWAMSSTGKIVIRFVRAWSARSRDPCSSQWTNHHMQYDRNVIELCAMMTDRQTDWLTRLASWLSIMKLWTCFSARVSSSLRARTATTSAVQPEPCVSISTRITVVVVGVVVVAVGVAAVLYQ